MRENSAGVVGGYMKGLELARKYYEAYGKDLLQTQFSYALPYLAIGLAGSGSECYGYDDETSRDHDFEPGFCIFLPSEDIIDRKTAFELERAYAKLPKEFLGFKRGRLSPVGGNRHGVIRMEEFFSAKTGSKDGLLSNEQWFAVPEYGLIEATNGAVFEDPYGQFSSIRERLRYFPEDVRRKKLAGHLLLMGQAGQYNYSRCIARGETAAAQLSVFEFTKSALHSIYLLNGSYMPYYKWSFKGLKGLCALGALSEDLEYLISSGNTPEEAAQKTEIIEHICSKFAGELKSQGLIDFENPELEQTAYALNDTITDHHIRTMHILHGV